MRFPQIVYAPDGEGQGGSGEGENEEAPVNVADKPREPTEYEKQLRRESAKYRTLAKTKDEELARIKAENLASIEAIKTASRSESDVRVIRAELKASALKAGMVDLDGLKLLDLSKVTLNDKNEIEGADALMADAKKSKPWLFTESTNTSSTQTTPPPKSGDKKLATEMAPGSDEYKTARRAITG